MHTDIILNNKVPNVFFPRPQRLYPWLKSYRKRQSIDTEKIDDILSEYDLYLVKKPKPSPDGFRNTSIIINTPRGKGVLKTYRKSLGDSTITLEHSILKYLSQIDFPATRVVETKSGQTLVKRGIDRHALFDYAEGSFRSFDYIAFPKQNHQYIAIAGEMLAELHKKLAAFAPQGYNPDGFKSKAGDRWRDTDWFADKLAVSLKETCLRNENFPKSEYAFLLQNATRLKSILVANTKVLNDTDLPRQIIHKDYRPSHLLLRKKASPVIIDFEIACLDWRLVDIIEGLRTFCRHRKRNYCYDKIRTFLSNYQAHSPLTSTELRFFLSVWELAQVWGCIFFWHQHTQTGSIGSLNKACKGLKDLDWVTANREIITRTLNMSRV